MEQTSTFISPEAVRRQLDCCREIAARNAGLPQPPLAFVDTYGCPNV